MPDITNKSKAVKIFKCKDVSKWPKFRKLLKSDVELEAIQETQPERKCLECTCYPYEELYSYPKPILRCHKSPPPLMAVAEDAVNKLRLPEALQWSIKDVCRWMEIKVGFPQYTGALRKNHINGMRLLGLEDPSRLPPMNITYHSHIRKITDAIRSLYGTEFICFSRSVGLPDRYPFTYVIRFNARTGPMWGFIRTATHGDILRFLQIIGPEPVYLDHWDLVWHLSPKYPRKLIGKLLRDVVHRNPVKPHVDAKLPHEYQVSRKFKLMIDIPEDHQFIWMSFKNPLTEDSTTKTVHTTRCGAASLTAKVEKQKSGSNRNPTAARMYAMFRRRRKPFVQVFEKAPVNNKFECFLNLRYELTSK